jgi:predicted small lipoprotein YifL
MVNPVMTRGSIPMKKIVIATAAVLALLSIAGCAQTGKGKAPPPVVTKG